MTIIEHLRAARRSFTVWLNAVLLAAYPFADSIIAALRDNLPDIAQYLPANVFRALGLALVIYNIAHGARTASKAAEVAK